MTGYVVAGCFMMGVMALIGLLRGVTGIDEPWARAVRIGVNMVIQPLCLYLFAGGFYKVVMALSGRFVYAWQVIPPEEVPPHMRAMLRRYFVMQGVTGCVFAASVSWFSLAPVLEDRPTADEAALTGPVRHASSALTTFPCTSVSR
jgi:hypothetical protein